MVGFGLLFAATFLAGAFLQRGGHLTGLANYLRSSPQQILQNIASAPMDPEVFPAIELSIKSTAMNALQENIQKALRIGRVTRELKTFKSGQLKFGEDEFRVNLRLKGDNVDHVDTEKTSFRIRLRDNKKFMGMSEFSISHPKARDFAHEWLFTQTIRHEGVLTPRNGFIRVTVNGKYLGIYIFEEHYTKEMLESQKRRESVVFYLSSLIRDWQRSNFHVNDPDAGRMGGWNFKAVPDYPEVRDIEVFKAGKAKQSPSLGKLRELGISKLIRFFGGELAADEVFDPEATGKALAIIELFAASNPAHPDNFRFYLNPYSQLLEPIVRESTIQTPISLSVLSTDDDMLPTLLADNKIATAFLEALDRYSDPQFLASLEVALDPRYTKVISGLRTEFPFVEKLWGDLEFRASFLNRILNPPKLTQAVAAFTGDGRKLALQVANVNAYPVEVMGIAFSDAPDTLIAANQGVLALRSYQPYWPRIGRNYRPLTLNTLTFDLTEDRKRALDQGAGLVLVSRLMGLTRLVRRPLTVLQRAVPEGRPATPSMVTFNAAHPFFEIEKDGRVLRSRPGVHIVSGDLVFPQGIIIELVAGTEFRLSDNSVMIVSGALRTSGTEDHPVVLGPASESWGGIVVLDAEGSSRLRHTKVFGTSGIQVGSWKLPGGVTFYRSDVEIIDSEFSGTLAEDALNVVNAEVHVRGSFFGNTASDGFDGDFVTGSFKDTEFLNIGGDGIDVSGSTLSVKRVALRNIADKAISVGEASTIALDASRIADVGIAVASKDGSVANVTGLRVARASKVAFAAYRKKPEYPHAALDASDSTISETAATVLVQEGSTANVNGKVYTGKQFNTKDLYAAGILGN